MAQNVNPASSSSSGYEKDAMERNSATSSSQVRIYGRPGRLWGQFNNNILDTIVQQKMALLNLTDFLKLGEQATTTGANVTNDVRR